MDGIFLQIHINYMDITDKQKIKYIQHVKKYIYKDI